MQASNSPQLVVGVSPTRDLPRTTDTACSPRIQFSRTTTASEILAAFSPKSQSQKEQQPWVAAPRFPITMTDGRGLRHKERVTYQISDDSDSEKSPSAADSTFSSPQKPRRVRIGNIINLEEDEIDDIEPAKTPPPRLSSAGHSLRQHSDLHLSLRAQENGDKPSRKKRRLSQPSKRRSGVAVESQTAPPTRTARNEIREMIATETGGKRSNFFVAKKDYFLPLLPDGNHIQRLAEQHSDEQETRVIVPYEALEHQPKG